MSQSKTDSSPLKQSSVQVRPVGLFSNDGAVQSPQPKTTKFRDLAEATSTTLDAFELRSLRVSNFDNHVSPPMSHKCNTPSPVPVRATTHDSHTPLFAPTSNGDPVHFKDHYADLVDRIDSHRWTLRDQRENLHGGRVRLHTQRQDLRETREKALAQVDSAFNLLKQYLLDRDVELPQEIRYAFEDASTWSARLEKQETDFQKAEESYDLEEWIYTEQESKFVDDMYAIEPFAPAPTQPIVRMLQTEGLTQHASGDFEVPLSSATTEGTSLHSLLAVDQLVEPPVVDQDRGSFTPALDSTLERSMTSKSLSALPSKQAPRLISRPYSENDLSQVKLDWSDTRARIEDWLLEALEQSIIQRDLLRRITAIDALDFQEWWPLVRHHWNSDSPGDDIFHTGDTTKPPTTTGRRTSVIDVTDMHINSVEGTPELQTSLASPLGPQDRVVDALEEFDFPPDIKPTDLLESFSEVSHGEVTSQRVVSRQVSLSPRSTAELFVHAENALATGALNPSVVSGRALSLTSHDTNSPDSRTGNDFGNAKKTSMSSANSCIAPPLAIRTHTASNRDSFDKPTSNPVPPLSLPTSFGTKDSPTSMGDDRPEATTRSTPFVQQQGPPFYIRVQDSTTWYLPLLRLTPTEASQISSSDHIRHTVNSHSQALPFVSNTSFIHRLPGPAPLC